MHTIIATFCPTPARATLDAGRQPLSYTPFNTPKTKTKKSATGRKQIAEDVFCPQAASTPPKIPFNRAKASEPSDDEDIPLALVMKLRSASLNGRPATVKRPEAIRRQAVAVDDDEDLPLIKVKERMMKFGLRSTIKRVVHRQPPKKRPHQYCQPLEGSRRGGVRRVLNPDLEIEPFFPGGFVLPSS